jgi:hypothetical protein
MKYRLLAVAFASGTALTFATAANAHADIDVYFGAAPAYEPPPPVVYAPPPPPVVYQPAPVYASPPMTYGGYDGYWDRPYRNHEWHGRDYGEDHGWHRGWHHEDDD